MNTCMVLGGGVSYGRAALVGGEALQLVLGEHMKNFFDKLIIQARCPSLQLICGVIHMYVNKTNKRGGTRSLWVPGEVHAAGVGIEDLSVGATNNNMTKTYPTDKCK